MSKRREVLAFVVRWKPFYPLIRFLGALGIAMVLYRFPLFFLEGALYDARVRISPTPTTSGLITTIAVDPKTLAALEGDPDTRDNTNVIEQLRNENPEAVVYMANPTKWVGDSTDKAKFSQMASSLTNFFFATEQIAPMGQTTHLRLPKPFDNLSWASAPITRDNVSFAADKVTRRILLAFEGQLLLQPILANLHNHIVNPHSYHGSHDSDGSIFSFIRYHPVGTYKPMSFIDVRDGRFPKGTFTNKIVIIGSDTQLDTDDYVLTPYSRYPLAMSRLEAQANVIDTLIQNNGVMRTPAAFDLVLTLLVAYLTVLIVWSARPLMGIILLLAQAGIFGFISYLLFASAGIWINLIHPLLAIFVSYYFFIPYRLIMENKRSWEYYQRNRLLTQVEELKTNFLSMMSHDLKTPIARIQGMAEIALNEPKQLSPNQKEALSTIIRSSEELGNFIGSILDLSRIEGKEVKLQKTSRDINSLLKEVVRKYEYNAHKRGIAIKTELEPLFSVKVDVDLIRQVFGNLVENAIKYSPENASVIISSKEEAGQITVGVTDSGPGIAKDELDNIFLKFYRSKAAKASPINGTGLGLYLAKYFIELHSGKISVDSVPAKGTTFTVQLPLG